MAESIVINAGPLITLAVKPYLEKAVAAGIRYDPELVQRVLEAAGE